MSPRAATRAKPRTNQPRLMPSVVATMDDAALFGRWFSGASWNGWRTVLKGAYGLPLLRQEKEFFRSVADRDPPATPVRELWIAAGRRCGKDSIASLIAAYSAALFDQRERLRPGERASILTLACDRDQARIVLNYTRAYFTDVPMLQAMVIRETANGFELDNGTDITVATNNFRNVRGRTILCAIFDEVAFWRDESSAAPDVETYGAVLPGTATLSGSLLIGISTPYRRAGLLFEKWRDHYGRDGDVLVIRAPSTTRRCGPCARGSRASRATPTPARSESAPCGRRSPSTSRSTT